MSYPPLPPSPLLHMAFLLRGCMYYFLLPKRGDFDGN